MIALGNGDVKEGMEGLQLSVLLLNSNQHLRRRLLRLK